MFFDTKPSWAVQQETSPPKGQTKRVTFKLPNLHLELSQEQVTVKNQCEGTSEHFKSQQECYINLILSIWCIQVKSKDSTGVQQTKTILE